MQFPSKQRANLFMHIDVTRIGSLSLTWLQTKVLLEKTTSSWAAYNTFEWLSESQQRCLLEMRCSWKDVSLELSVFFHEVLLALCFLRLTLGRTTIADKCLSQVLQSYHQCRFIWFLMLANELNFFSCSKEFGSAISNTVRFRQIYFHDEPSHLLFRKTSRKWNYELNSDSNINFVELW